MIILKITEKEAGEGPGALSRKYIFGKTTAGRK